MADPAPSEAPRYRYFDFIMAAFVTILICSNLMAGKRCQIHGFTFGAGIVFFPLSYLFGDILTEVYGYARSRRVVWTGFVCLSFSAFMGWVVVSMPPAPTWTGQHEFETVFGNAWRVVLASLLAYFWGEFSNSFVLAKMKIFTKGQHMWTRFLGSTIVGEFVDSLIFYPVAFLGISQAHQVLLVMLGNYTLKVLWETLMLPFTYRFVNFLKSREKQDYYDYTTNFTPFSLQD